MFSLLFIKLAEPTIRYCEPNLRGWIAQPANAVSSLLITLVGIYFLAKRSHKYSIYLGTIAIILGLASFSYYASFTFVGQLADLGSMYLLASLLILVALRRYSLSTKASLVLLSVLAGIPLILTAILRTLNEFNIGIPIFSLILLGALVLEIQQAKKDRFKFNFFILTFAALAIGYIFWWLDYKKIWCNPGSAHYINGHALWHLFNALALLSLNKYYQQIKEVSAKAS